VAEDDTVTDNTPAERLDAIGAIGRADQRGRMFERYVADVFRQHHFKVTMDPKTARPRQTDVLAAKVHEVYLIECKWRSDKANMDDLDSLRSRLRRVDGAVVGILISYHGFTGTVLHDVEHFREQPILLVSGDELRELGTRVGTLPDLLWRKKEALLTDGKVLLDEPYRSRRARRKVLFSLPATAHQFESADAISGNSFSRMSFLTLTGSTLKAWAWPWMWPLKRQTSRSSSN
jgi:Holliday junction resolvase